MEAKASARHVRVTPQKARRIVDLIRGKQAVEAIAVLRFAPQSASDPMQKVLESAIANAPGQGGQGLGGLRRDATWSSARPSSTKARR